MVGIVDGIALESFLSFGRFIPGWNNGANANWRYDNAVFGHFIRPYDFLNSRGDGMWAPCAGLDLYPEYTPPCIMDLSTVLPVEQENVMYWVHTWGFKRLDGYWVPITDADFGVRPILKLTDPAGSQLFAQSEVVDTLQPFSNGLNAFALPPDFLSQLQGLRDILGGAQPGIPSLTAPMNLKLSVEIPVDQWHMTDPGSLGWTDPKGLRRPFSSHAAAYLGGTGQDPSVMAAYCPGPAGMNLDPTGTVSDYCRCGQVFSSAATLPTGGSQGSPLSCGAVCGCLDPDGLRMRLVSDNTFCRPLGDCDPGTYLIKP